MEREEFHKIKGYFGYEVSLNGHVRRTSHGKTTDLDVIQPFGRDVNYVRMKIGKDHKEAKVSYLIALAFLPKERGDVLICMNGDWNDYSIDNYMWVNPRTLPENNSKEWRRVKGFNKKYEVSEDGELLIRGPNVLKRYHNMPERTAMVLDADGWFHTGDTGRIDEDGYVWITGRMSRTIILSSGKKIAPEELEAKLLTIAGVRESLVRGDGATREITAEVYGDITETELKNAVGRMNLDMPVYKRISRVIVRKEPFPKTASGKIKLNPPDEIQTR